METDALDQRQQFVTALAGGHWSMTELCARFGISRPTGYKWLARYRVGGAAAVWLGRAEAPAGGPAATPDEGLAGAQHGQ